MSGLSFIPGFDAASDFVSEHVGTANERAGDMVDTARGAIGTGANMATHLLGGDSGDSLGSRLKEGSLGHLANDFMKGKDKADDRMPAPKKPFDVPNRPGFKPTENFAQKAAGKAGQFFGQAKNTASAFLKT
jgi:hypothetical protein